MKTADAPEILKVPIGIRVLEERPTRWVRSTFRPTDPATAGKFFEPEAMVMVHSSAMSLLSRLNRSFRSRRWNRKKVPRRSAVLVGVAG